MGIFVYPHDCTDFSTTGLCGDLQPIEAYFEEEKNGISQIEMTLQYDELGEWKEAKVGRYISALVPVRVVPAIENDSYSTTVQKIRIKSGTRKVYTDKTCTKVLYYYKNQKGMISHVELPIDPEGVVAKSYVSAGVAEIVTSTYKACIYQDDYEIIEQVEIPAALDGVESVTGTARLKPQFFIITSVEQTLEGMIVTAKHVFYELLANATTYKTENTVQGAAACRQVFNNLISADDRFEIYSDCTDEQTALDYDRVSPVQALLDPDEGICAKYGLSLIRDNYSIYALKNVGTDRGFVVEYGKNMLSVDCIENIDETYTRIIPFGKDKKGNAVYMDGQKWVDSERINDYPAPRVLVLDCTDTASEGKDMNLSQVKAELKRRAEEELANGIDKPNLEMTVDFLSLGDTEEYKQYRGLDKVYMFDRITVKDKVRGYNYTAEVVAVRHNLLTGMLESCTIGSLETASAARKIASWQVPTVDGGNIRLQSIVPGILGADAVATENIQDNAVVAEKINAGAIEADKIQAGAVTAEKVDADAIKAKHLSADAMNAVNAQLKTAEIGWADINELTAVIANIASGKIQNADIDFAHIKDLAADTAIITQGVGGELYISRLAVTEANMVSLSVGQLLVKGEDGGFYALTVDESGNVTTEKKQVGNDDIGNLSINAGEKLIEGSITAVTMNVQDIFADSAIIRYLMAANMDVDTFFAREATIDAINALDIRGNQYLKLSVDALRQEIQSSASDGTGQQMTISFSQGNAIEEERKSITASVHIWKNGEEITDQIPAQAFSWMMEGGGEGVWYGVKEVTLSREDIGKSCQLRCILDEAGSFGTFEIVDGELILTRPDTGVTDAFTLSDGSLYGEEHYTLEDGMLSRNAASNKMQVTTSVFDHSILETSHILIKDKAIDIRSGGNITIEAGGSLNMAASAMKLTATTTLEDELNNNANAAANAQSAANAANTAASNAQSTANSAMAEAQKTPSKVSNGSLTLDENGIDMQGGKVRIQAGATFQVESGGTANIDAEDGHVNLGEDFSVSDQGSLVAKTGSFANGLFVGGKEVGTGPDIVVSTTEPSQTGIIWLKPSSVLAVSYGMDTGDARNTIWYDGASGNQSHTFSLTADTEDTMVNGTFLYTLRFPLYEIKERRSNVKISITAQKAGGTSSVVFPDYTLAEIRQWQEVIVEATVQSNVNLGADTSAINVTIAMDGVNSNGGLCLQSHNRIALSMVNQTATDSVMPCEIFYKP